MFRNYDQLGNGAQNLSRLWIFHLQLVHGESRIGYPPMPHPVSALHQYQPFAEHCKDSRVHAVLVEMPGLLPENLPHRLVIEEADLWFRTGPIQQRGSCTPLKGKPFFSTM